MSATPGPLSDVSPTTLADLLGREQVMDFGLRTLCPTPPRVAGPAFTAAGPFGYTPKGATGSAVRTLVSLAERTAAGELG